MFPSSYLKIFYRCCNTIGPLWGGGESQWVHVNCPILRLAAQWQFRGEDRLIRQPSAIATGQRHLYCMTLAALAKTFPEIYCCFSTNSSNRINLFWMCNWFVTEGHQRMSCAGAFNAASVVAVEHRDLKISEMCKVSAWQMMLLVTVRMSAKDDHNNYSKNTWTKHRFMSWTFLVIQVMKYLFL